MKDVESAKLQRALFRRDSNEQTHRCIKLKLGMFPMSQIENNTLDGKHIPETVKSKVAECKLAKKHIPLTFWTQLISDFKLKGSITEALAVPVEAEVVNPHLDAGMKVAHSANPAARSCEKLVRFLEFSPGLNRTEMYGLLKGSYESPSLSRTMSQQILRRVWDFIARTQSHIKHADYWKELKHSFDQLMVGQWRKAQSDGVPRVNFLRAHRIALSLFLPMDDATKVVVAVEAEEEPPRDIVVALQKCGLIGGELFSAEVMKVEIADYCKGIDRRIYQLEHLNFYMDEVGSFRAIMLHSAENLDQDVFKEFDGKQTEVPFLNAKVSHIIANANDYWQDRFQARAKTLAIANGQLERTAWEKMILGESDGIDLIPSTVTVPDALLFDAMNAREYVNTKLLGRNWTTVSAMQATIMSHREAIRKLDSSFWMEIDFLMVSFGKFLGNFFGWYLSDFLKLCCH